MTSDLTVGRYLKNFFRFLWTASFLLVPAPAGMSLQKICNIIV